MNPHHTTFALAPADWPGSLVICGEHRVLGGLFRISGMPLMRTTDSANPAKRNYAEATLIQQEDSR